jgi:D-alanine transaminase
VLSSLSRCDIKSTALIASSLAKQKALDLGCDDAIFLKDNMVMEATFANVFIVDQKNVLITRMTDQFILAGITRKRILTFAQQKKISIQERAFGYQEMLAAKELFITSATLMIRPVSTVDNTMIGNGSRGKMTEMFQKMYQEFTMRETLP